MGKRKIRTEMRMEEKLLDEVCLYLFPEVCHFMYRMPRMIRLMFEFID